MIDPTDIAERQSTPREIVGVGKMADRGRTSIPDGATTPRSENRPATDEGMQRTRTEMDDLLTDLPGRGFRFALERAATLPDAD
jgi:hypothetical protein